jgi:hypothetical protein
VGKIKKGVNIMKTLKLIILIVMVNIFTAGIIYVGYTAGYLSAEIDYELELEDEAWYEEMSEKYRRI